MKEDETVKKTKFYVCENCEGFMQGVGENQVICCGKPVVQLKPKQRDEKHSISISEVEDDFYIEFNHEMTKEHFISFAAYVGIDRVLMIRLYPEQAASVRFPRMRGGKFYYYCAKHGLFEYKL